MATINAASCSDTDIQAAVDSAVDGDIVVAPASGGPITWTTGVTCTGKAITIQGAGIGSSIIVDGFSSRNTAFFGINHQNTSLPFRLTGFEMRGNGLGALTYGAVTVYGSNLLSGNSQWRIDNCRFYQITGRPAYFWAIAGLVDHCDIEVHGQNSGFVSDGRCGTEGTNEKGHRTWANPAQTGTADEGIFLEDCTIAYTTVRKAITDAFCGGKWVVRRCALTNCCIENHGTESTGVFRGGRWLAALDNTLGGAIATEYLVLFRSGSGVVRGNVTSGASPGLLRMANYRETTTFLVYGGATGNNQCDSNDPTVYGTGTVTTASGPVSGGYAISDSSQSWTTNQWAGHHIRNTTTDVGSVVISNTATQVVYQSTIGGAFVNPTWAVGNTFEFRKILRALDQPGVGAGDLLVGGSNSAWPGTLPTNPSTSPGDIWPRQAIEPIYHWDNTGTVLGVSNNGHYTIASGTHYKNEAHPTYVEYTYPHPLTGSLAAPTFLSQPSNQTVTAGTTATFTCAASGNPAPTYQWRKNGSDISGATSAGLVITNAQDANEGTYDCVSTNSQDSATSTGATLTVNPDVADTTPPAPNPSTVASVTVNSSSQITVTADTAIDVVSPPVEYNHSIGGVFAGWQSSATRAFTGLTASTLYSFTVKARDAEGNETTASGASTATTLAITVVASPSPLGHRGTLAGFGVF